MANRILSLANKKDQVFIGGQSEIYGGYIFNVSTNFGFSNSTNKIEVSIVSKDGQYDRDTLRNDLSTSIPTTISFGGILEVDPIYLYSYEIKRTERDRILQLTYVDGSVLLDKVWVGINYNEGLEFEEEPVTKLLSFDVGCSPCPGYTERRQLSFDNIPILQKVAKVNQNTIDRQKGGYIIMGDVDFSDDPCKIAPVSYNFTQLKDILSANGIVIDSLPDVNPDYRQKYKGTLRDVLNNWCSDFGHTFYWNSIRKIGNSASVEPDIIGLDLSNPQIDIDLIRSTFEALDSDRSKQTVISSMDESYSLENTKKIYRLSSFKKDRETETPQDINIYLQKQISCILPSSLSKYNTYRYGRSYEQFITSCMLAGIDENLRNIYNYKIFRRSLVLADTSIQSFKRIIETPIQSEVIGFDSMAGTWTFSQNEQEEYFGKGQTPFSAWLNDGAKEDDFPELKKLGYNKTSKPPIEYLIGFENEELKSDLITYEKAIGEFIGKYYKYRRTSKDYKDSYYCSNDEYAEVKVSTVPDSTSYNVDSTDAESSPFSNLIKDVWNNVLGKDDLLFERAGTYGGSSKIALQEIISFDSNRLSFGAKFEAVDVLESYMPKSVFSQDEIIEILSDISVDYQEYVLKKYGKSHTFYAAPKMEILDAVINISTINFGSLVENTKEDWSAESQTSQDTSKCETTCEVKLTERLCKCLYDSNGNPLDENENSIPPYAGLLNRDAPYINITAKFSDSTASQYYVGGEAVFDPDCLKPVSTNTRSIISPTQSDYFMYFVVNFSQKYTKPFVAVVEGSIGDAGGLASIDVVAEDITTQIDSFYNAQGNLIINTFTPGVNNDYFPRDPAEYHRLRIQSLPQSIEEPEHRLTLNLVGLDSSYVNYLSPKSGLSSFDVNYSTEGLSVTLSYENRPPDLPEPDVVSKRIGPKLNNYNANRL